MATVVTVMDSSCAVRAIEAQQLRMPRAHCVAPDAGLDNGASPDSTQRVHACGGRISQTCRMHAQVAGLRDSVGGG